MAKAVKTPKTNAMRELESAGISYVYIRTKTMVMSRRAWGSRFRSSLARSPDKDLRPWSA